MAATDDERAEQMRTQSDADQEPPVTTPTPDETQRRVAGKDDETDEIGNPVTEADEAREQEA
jgi:hypothetical protein